MKNILLTFLSIFLFVSVSAQKHKATIYFKNGTSIKGLAKIDGEKIIYKTSKKAKRKWFDHTTVNRIDIKDLGKSIYHRLYYKKINNSTSFQLLELYKRGRVSVYIFPHIDSNTPKNTNNNIRLGVSGGLTVLLTNNSKGNFYLCKNKSESVTNFSNKKKIFREETSEYFKDCPILVDKINSRKFKSKHLIKIIDFYNKNCK